MDQKFMERRKSRHIDVWKGGHTGPYGARGPIKHPSGNLQPAAGARTAQAAPENITLGLADYLMDGNGKPEPGVPGIKDLTEQDSVGVLKPCCTTMSGRIPASAAPHPPRQLCDRRRNQLRGMPRS
jgi:hypothetical protein